MVRSNPTGAVHLIDANGRLSSFLLKEIPASISLDDNT